MRTQALRIIALIGWWLWSHTSWGQSPEALVSGLDREQLLQRKVALQQQKEVLDGIWRSEVELQRQADEYYEKYHTLQSDLPQPSLPPYGGTVLVRIESVRQVNGEVIKAYPDSSPYLHYYEVQARVLKVWQDEWAHPYMSVPFRLHVGDVLLLLWVGCKRLQDGTEIPAPSIWENGRVYLVYELGITAKTGPPVAPKLGQAPSSSSTDLHDYWFVPRSQCYRIFKYSSPYDILKYQGGISMASVCWRVEEQPTTRIESPSKEILQVLDEEAEFYRLPERRAAQLAWVKQRVLDKNLPLWKRQRALVYWFLADNAQKEVPVSQHGELYVRQQIEYLTFLNGLSEPLLQAFGLRRVWGRPSGWWSVSLELVNEWLEALAPFLAEERPAKVRREAAAVLTECLVQPGAWHWLDANREWALERARWLRTQAEQEKDSIVKAQLGKAWRTIIGTDINRQLEAIEKRLRELGQGE